MTDLAPIVLFVYNRVWHVKQTINSLKNNDLALESELIIYSDGPKDSDKISNEVIEVRKYLKEINGFKKITVIERENNLGLSASIIDGVSSVLDKFGSIIVLEDDMLTSPLFLKYMNSALNLYKDNSNVISIHGYQYPLNDYQNLPDTFFIKGADCWGWATWSRGWNFFEPNGTKLLNELNSKKLQKEADFNNTFNFTQMLKDQINGKNDSWAVRWYMSAFINNKLTLYPKKSFVHNIGNDGSGSHCSETDIFLISDFSNEIVFENNNHNIAENLKARGAMEKYFSSLDVSLRVKIKNRLRDIFSI
jgi:hypothetical protein